MHWTDKLMMAISAVLAAALWPWLGWPALAAPGAILLIWWLGRILPESRPGDYDWLDRILIALLVLAFLLWPVLAWLTREGPTT